MKIEVWNQVWDKFKQFILPAIKNPKDQEIKKLYWFGSRMSGKTVNLILSMWKLRELHPKKKINIIWARSRVQQANQTFATIKTLIPDFYKIKTSRKPTFNKKLYIHNFDRIMSYQYLNVQVIALEGGLNKSFKQGIQVANHQLLGVNFAPCDVRLIIFEEAYQMDKFTRHSLLLAARFSKIRFIFYIFNNYSKISDLVEYVERKIPYDINAMGEKIVTSKKSDVSNVEGEQKKIIDDEFFWRLNYILLKKDKLLLEADEDALWETANEDESRKGTVLFGKCGNPIRGIFGKNVQKLKWVKAEEIWRLRNTNWKWEFNRLNIMAGLDLGYSKDDTSLVIVIFDAEWDEFIIWKTLIIKTSNKTITLKKQSEMISSFLYRFIQEDMQFKINKIILIMNNFINKQIDLEEHFNFYKIKDFIDIHVILAQTDVRERVDWLARKLAGNKIKIVESETNKILFEQMDAVTWRQNTTGGLVRVGYQDSLEALEIACLREIRSGK